VQQADVQGRKAVSEPEPVRVTQAGWVMAMVVGIRQEPGQGTCPSATASSALACASMPKNSQAVMPSTMEASPLKEMEGRLMIYWGPLLPL
jgi:hypothetical protein